MMLTAKHCLFDNNNKHWNNLFIIQILPNNEHVLRPIMRIYFNESDVAILIPARITVKSIPMCNPVLTITNFNVNVGERIASFVWPSTRTYYKDNQALLDMNTKWHYGIVEDFHANGFSFLKNPCYQSCMSIEGGSSGGPVSNSQGHIFAINSIGADVSPELEAYSFLSPISSCFDIRIQTDKDKWHTIKELIELKEISFSGFFITE